MGWRCQEDPSRRKVMRWRCPDGPQQEEGDEMEVPRWTQWAACMVLDVSQWMCQSRSSRTDIWGRLHVLAGGATGKWDGFGPTIPHGPYWLGSPELRPCCQLLQGHTAAQHHKPCACYKPMSLPMA